MLKLHFWKNNPSEKTLSSGIFVSMLLVVFCIIVLLLVAWLSLSRGSAERAKQQYAQSWINEQTNKWWVSSTQTIDTTDHTQSAGLDIVNRIKAIKQQSEAQLTQRQETNANESFAPEGIIPRYFKIFYGDLSSMHARR